MVEHRQVEGGHYWLAIWVFLVRFLLRVLSESQSKPQSLMFLFWARYKPWRKVMRILRGRDTRSYSKVEQCYREKQKLCWEVGMRSMEDQLHFDVRGEFNKFPDFLVQAFRIVIDTWKFSLLLLYIIGDDIPIFMISGSKEQLTIGIHPTKAWLSQRVNFKNAIWHFRRTTCNKILF